MSNRRLKAGLIGWPVAHSLSPRLHRFWLDAYGIDGDYVALAVQPDGLEAAVKQCVKEGWAGFNLTIPHKEAIIPLLDEMDDTAKRIGAVNTVIIKEGKLIGRNTDAYGFMENIRPHIRGKHKAVVLGAGGAARAVVDALFCDGFEHIVIVNRSIARAQQICRGQSEFTVVAWQQRARSLFNVDVLINTTSLGMDGKKPLEIDLHLLSMSTLVNDIVYTPLITPLLAQVKARGNPVVDGLGMLLHQAVPAFEAWFGTKPDVTQKLREHMLSGGQEL
jgi:shikimate dehydrogenase